MPTLRVTKKQEQGLNEYFSFLSLLGSDPKLKYQYYTLAKRSDREKFIADLGFKPRAMRAAIESVQFEVEGKQYTLLSWLKSKGYDDNSELPVKVVEAVLHKSGLIKNFSGMEDSFKEYLAVVGSAAGGAALAPSTAKVRESKPSVEAEVDGAEGGAEAADASTSEIYGSDAGAEANEASNDVASDARESSSQETYEGAGAYEQTADTTDSSQDINSLVSNQLADYSSATDTLMPDDSQVGSTDAVTSSTTDISIDKTVDFSTPGFSDTVDGVDVQAQGTGTLTIDASIDVDRSDLSDSTVSFDGTSLDIQENLSATGSGDFANQYGSVDLSGSASSTIDLNIDPTNASDPVSVTSSGLNLNVTGNISETGPGIKESGDQDGVSANIDEQSTLTGEFSADANINLQDPSASTGSITSSSLEINENLSASATDTVSNAYGEVDLSGTATNSATLDINPQNTADPVSVQSSGINYDLTANIKENASESANFSTGNLTGELTSDTSITGTINADGTINLENPSADTVSYQGTNIDVDESLGATTTGTFTNAYGSIDTKGTASSNISANINPTDTSDPVTVDSSGVEFNTSATVNEKYDSTADFTSGIKPEATLTGSVDLGGTLDLQDPSASTISSRSSSLDLGITASTSESGQADIDGVDVGLTVGGNLDLNLKETSDDGSYQTSYSAGGSSVDIDLSAKETEPIVVEESGDTVTTVQPQAAVDVDLNVNDSDQVTPTASYSYNLNEMTYTS